MDLLSLEQSRQTKLLNESFVACVASAVSSDPAADVEDALKDYVAYSKAIKRRYQNTPAAATSLYTWGSGECGQLGRELSLLTVYEREGQRGLLGGGAAQPAAAASAASAKGAAAEASRW